MIYPPVFSEVMNVCIAMAEHRVRRGERLLELVPCGPSRKHRELSGAHEGFEAVNLRRWTTGAART